MFELELETLPPLLPPPSSPSTSSSPSPSSSSSSSPSSSPSSLPFHGLSLSIAHSAVPKAIQSEESFQTALSRAHQLSWTTKGLVDAHDPDPPNWIQKPTPGIEVESASTEESAVSVLMSSIEVEEVAGWAEACRLVVHHTHNTMTEREGGKTLREGWRERM
jgi:hypothetical protein